MTPQRIAILEYLKDNESHPSAEDIYSEVSRRFPTMSFATVYNTLETLRERGDLRELTIDSDRLRFDPDMRPHHHLICTACRKIADVHLEFPLQLPEGGIEDFEVTGNHVEFYGLCSECRKKRR